MQFIFWYDYLLAPVFIFLFYRIAKIIKEKNSVRNPALYKHFMPGLVVKIIGAIFISLVYQYYYGGGDTSLYFYHANVINSALDESVSKWLQLLFRIPYDYENGFVEYTSLMEWYNDPATYFVCSVTAIINVFTFNSYLSTSIVFAVLSYTGFWALYRLFCRQYPALINYLSISVLYIPSCIIWGSGIYKDTICMSALGWFAFTAFNMLIDRRISFFNILVCLISFYVLVVVKIYIVLAFMPALLLWILFMHSHKIKNRFLRQNLKFFVLASLIIMSILVFNLYSKELGRYSLDRIAHTSSETRSWITYTSGESGSSYDLGEFSPTLLGILSKFPQAINVTLFRPYLWEARKPLVFFNALESLVFLIVTLRVLFTIGIVKVWKTIADDPNIQFCLVFTLIFAFAVGISTYNFGALSRYKIPCLPMYATALVLIYYKNRPNEQSFFGFFKRRQ